MQSSRLEPVGDMFGFPGCGPWVPWEDYGHKILRVQGAMGVYLPCMANASHGPRRPIAHRDTAHHASKARAQAAMAVMEAKACCDHCGVSLGLWSPGRGMQDIRDAHWVWDLKVLCEPCTVAMEGRMGVREEADDYLGCMEVMSRV